MSLSLRELVDVDLEAALEVGGLVLVDNADLREFVDHSVHLRSTLLGSFLVSGVAEVADRVPRSLCIIVVMQSVPLVLARSPLCGFRVCHYFIFLFLVVGRRIELLLRE